MDNELKQFERKIKNRDYLEIGVALLLIPYFGRIAYYSDNLLTQIGSVIIMLSCLFIIYKLRVVKKYKKIDLTSNLKEQLIQMHYYVKQEKALIDNILTWYLLPPHIGLTIFFLGTAGFGLKWIGIVVFNMAIVGGIYWINQRSARTYYEPLIKQLEKVIAELS